MDENYQKVSIFMENFLSFNISKWPPLLKKCANAPRRQLLNWILNFSGFINLKAH